MARCYRDAVLHCVTCLDLLHALIGHLSRHDTDHVTKQERSEQDSGKSSAKQQRHLEKKRESNQNDVAVTENQQQRPHGENNLRTELHSGKEVRTGQRDKDSEESDAPWDNSSNLHRENRIKDTKRNSGESIDHVTARKRVKNHQRPRVGNDGNRRKGDTSYSGKRTLDSGVSLPRHQHLSNTSWQDKSSNKRSSLSPEKIGTGNGFMSDDTDEGSSLEFLEYGTEDDTLEYNPETENKESSRSRKELSFKNILKHNSTPYRENLELKKDVDDLTEEEDRGKTRRDQGLGFTSILESGSNSQDETNPSVKAENNPKWNTTDDDKNSDGFKHGKKRPGEKEGGGKRTTQKRNKNPTGEEDKKTTGQGKQGKKDRRQQQRFQCPLCEHWFPWRSALKVHMVKHSQEKAFRCDQCSKRFKCEQSLKQHGLTQHGQHLSRRRVHLCDRCDKSYASRMRMEQHILVEHEKNPYVCAECGKIFKSLEYYQIHIKSHQDGVLQCEKCGKAFAGRKFLRQHMQTHSAEKPHKCDQCEKAFRTKDQLRTHSVVHTGVRRFQCPVCSKAFTQSGALDTHMKIHTGVKPFQCEQCKKRFTLKAHLKQHMPVHTGEKPHKCERCGDAFSYPSALAAHKAKHCIGATHEFTTNGL